MCRDAALFLCVVGGFLRQRCRHSLRPVERPSLLHIGRFLLCDRDPMSLHADSEQRDSECDRNARKQVGHELGQYQCHGTIPKS